MTVKELIERLQQCDLAATVRAFDADSGSFEEVSGLVHNYREVVLQTDDHS